MNDIPDAFLNAVNTRRSPGRRAAGLGAVGDFDEPFTTGVRPVPAIPSPAGPSNFPVNPAASTATTEQLLAQVLAELVKQNTASKPVIRSSLVVGGGGDATLDWTTIGIMDRIVMRNIGPGPVWFAFDINGPAVNPFTGDQSFEIQVGESINLSNCSFRKIGLRTDPTNILGATVNAIGFQAVAGNQAASIL